MARYFTSPFLFDEAKSLSITDLKKLNYLIKDNYRTGIIRWSCRGEQSGSISISVDLRDYKNIVVFDYKCNGNKYEYAVNLESIPSNLGKGKIWYFVCPLTKKLCRKLHLINEMFMHRSNLPSGMYSVQTESKNWRRMSKFYGSYYKLDDYYEELYSKHFKTHYNGKPTKRYLKLIEQIKKVEDFSASNLNDYLSCN